MKSLQQKIIDLREARDWSQVTLAKKMNLSKSVMNKIESGSRKISADELRNFACLFQVSADYLLGLQETPMHTTTTEQLRLKALLKSQATIYYDDEILLTPNDQQIISDIVIGYVEQRKQRKEKQNDEADK
jgi:Predicted transcription factor, homolog of eukaryotic MBF1